MLRKWLLLVAAVALMISLGACKKKEEAPISQQGAGGGVQDIPAVAPEIQVVVPENVKGTWKAVKLTIEDKVKNTTDDVVVNLGSEYAIPGSKIRIKVGDFLPDFRMQGSVITTASEEPNNPAVHVDVYDGEEQVFKGWLYSRFPGIHPFDQEKYGIKLKEPLKKS
jgi:hypothetical protein